MDRLISEQAVIDTIYDSRNNFKNEFDQGFFADKIRALPPVNPQPRTGHWIEKDGYEYTCSECGRSVDPGGIFENQYTKFPYCHCGAKMQEVEA